METEMDLLELAMQQLHEDETSTMDDGGRETQIQTVTQVPFDPSDLGRSTFPVGGDVDLLFEPTLVPLATKEDMSCMVSVATKLYLTPEMIQAKIATRKVDENLNENEKELGTKIVRVDLDETEYEKLTQTRLMPMPDGYTSHNETSPMAGTSQGHFMRDCPTIEELTDGTIKFRTRRGVVDFAKIHIRIIPIQDDLTGVFSAVPLLPKTCTSLFYKSVYETCKRKIDGSIMPTTPLERPRSPEKPKKPKVHVSVSEVDRPRSPKKTVVHKERSRSPEKRKKTKIPDSVSEVQKQPALPSCPDLFNFFDTPQKRPSKRLERPRSPEKPKKPKVHVSVSEVERPRSPKKTEKRPRSPEKHKKRPRSPEKTEKRPRSPEKHKKRPRSPEKTEKRPRSPEKHKKRPRSPEKHEKRPRSPAKHKERPRSPEKHKNRPRSPEKVEKRPRSPGKLDARKKRSRSPEKRKKPKIPASVPEVQKRSTLPSCPDLASYFATPQDTPKKQQILDLSRGKILSLVKPPPLVGFERIPKKSKTVETKSVAPTPKPPPPKQPTPTPPPPPPTRSLRTPSPPMVNGEAVDRGEELPDLGGDDLDVLNFGLDLDYEDLL